MRDYSVSRLVSVMPLDIFKVREKHNSVTAVFGGTITRYLLQEVWT